MSATMVDPTLERRLVHLGRANQVRIERANVKRELRAQRCSVGELLAAPPECLLSMTVFDLLVAAPKLGRAKANTVLGRCRISPVRTVGALTDRQRRELAVALTSAGWRR